MKQSRFLPVHRWYDHHGDAQFDYTLLSGYQHFVASFVYMYFDPNSFGKIGLEQLKDAGLLPITWEIKLAMRITVYVFTVLTYYPIVVAVSMLLVDARKPLLRLILVSLLLNAPLFILVDFVLVQFNCLHYGLYLLAYLFAYRKRFVESTVITTICLHFKHMSAPMVFPIGFYAIAHTLKKAQDQSAGQKVKAVAWIIVKLLLIAFAISFVVLIPVMREESWKNMMRNLFTIAKRKLLSGAINLWSFLDFLVMPYDTPEYRPMWLKICSLLVAINASVVGYFLIKKPTKNSFATGFTLTHLGLFIFGYYMHEKHTSYAYYSLVLSFQFSKDILPVAYQLFTFGAFLVLAWNADNPIQIFLLIFGTAHTVVCKELLNRDPELQVAYNVKGNKDCTAKMLKNFLEKINGVCPRLMKWFFVYIAVFFAVNIWSEISHLDFIDRFRELGMYKAPFFLMVMLYAHQWMLLYLQTTDDVEIKDYSRKVKAK
eukprot:TRINITY_DN11662_c0_g1_i9.p1 TRINITY_DN11662_c0_g1~~TRINITY_DN11662_c0_g1_i9.p1  ORF type:complete len:485 (+),score=115.38 TRINITY_DN11662_c0_g1_i9:308-1762(+)